MGWWGYQGSVGLGAMVGCGGGGVVAQQEQERGLHICRACMLRPQPPHLRALKNYWIPHPLFMSRECGLARWKQKSVMAISAPYLPLSTKSPLTRYLFLASGVPLMVKIE